MTRSAFGSLEGKNALVTGASRGIGRAIAADLAAAGASVALSYRTGADEAASLAAEIGARALQADVSDPESARTLVDEAGDLDILVNNAGAVWGAPAEDHPLEAWDKLVEEEAEKRMDQDDVARVALPQWGSQ